LNFRHRLNKNSNTKFRDNLSSGNRAMRKNGRTETDMTKLTVAFPSLTNAPKNVKKYLVTGYNKRKTLICL